MREGRSRGSESNNDNKYQFEAIELGQRKNSIKRSVFVSVKCDSRRRVQFHPNDKLLKGKRFYEIIVSPIFSNVLAGATAQTL